MRLLPLLIIFVFTLAIFGSTISKKMVGHHDWNSVVYSASARALAGKSDTGDLFYQKDYPPLLPLVISLSFIMFGIYDWSARLVPIFFTFASAVMIYKIAGTLWKEKIGLAAAIIYLCTPLLRYFGKIPVHETIVPFFALLVFYFYWLWFSHKTPMRYILLIISILLAELSGWPGYYTIPVITLHYLLSTKSKNTLQVLNWWLISFLSFLLFLLTIRLITGRLSLSELWQIFMTRAALDSDNQTKFTIAGFISKELLWIRLYLTRVLSIFVAGFISISAITKFKTKNINPGELLLLGLLLFGLIHIILFSELSYLHDYMIIYLFPFFSISGALAIDWFSSRIRIGIYTVLICILVLMFFESRQFLRDLEKADYFLPAYTLGTYAHDNTKPKEKIYLYPFTSSKFYNVFFYYYADRNSGTGDLTDEIFAKNKKNYEDSYRLIVVDTKYTVETDKNLTDYLQGNYRETDIGQFKIFDLKDKKS